MAEELLQAADQYMLEGLKRLCEVAISRTLSVDSLPVAQEVILTLPVHCDHARLMFVAVFRGMLCCHLFLRAPGGEVHQHTLLLAS